MSTPQTPGTYRVTWSPGEGNGAPPHVQEVQAVSVEIHTGVGFTVLYDEDGASVLMVNNAFLVSVERIAEGAATGA